MKDECSVNLQRLYFLNGLFNVHRSELSQVYDVYVMYGSFDEEK